MGEIFVRGVNKVERGIILLLCLLLWISGRILFLRYLVMRVPKDKIQRVLIFAWGGIGNVLLFTPVLKNLRRILPGAHICGKS
jgi:hypothetical protein